LIRGASLGQRHTQLPNFEASAREDRQKEINKYRNYLNDRYWPKADTRGRVLGPKIGYPAFFGLLSDRFQDWPRRMISHGSFFDLE